MRLLFIITIALSITTMSCSNSERSMCLIPEGYAGTVVIFYNQKDGVPAKRKDGFRVYEIPENGILKTRFSPNDGKLYNPNENDLYFYLDSEGGREKIPVKWTTASKVDSAINQVYRMQRGTIGDDIQYLKFNVGKYSDRHEYYFENTWKENEWWDSIIKENDVK